MTSPVNRLQEMIELVAQALGDDLLQDVAFVGGATTGLLVTDDVSREDVRYTDDVDLIVRLAGKAEWGQLQRRLREKGFKESMEDDVNCRMRLGELKVDFMPDDESVLGYTNRWFHLAVDTARFHPLNERTRIRLVTPPYFIATKLEAYAGRGGGDPLGSADIEDILNLVNGRDELLDEIAAADAAVRDFIADGMRRLLRDPSFPYAVQSCAGMSEEREALLFDRLETLATGVRAA